MAWRDARGRALSATARFVRFSYDQPVSRARLPPSSRRGWQALGAACATPCAVPPAALARAPAASPAQHLRISAPGPRISSAFTVKWRRTPRHAGLCGVRCPAFAELPVQSLAPAPPPTVQQPPPCSCALPDLACCQQQLPATPAALARPLVRSYPAPRLLCAARAAALVPRCSPPR